MVFTPAIPVHPIITPRTYFVPTLSRGTVFFSVSITAAITGKGSETSTIQGSGVLAGAITGHGSETSTLHGLVFLAATSITGKATLTGVLVGSPYSYPPLTAAQWPGAVPRTQ